MKRIAMITIAAFALLPRGAQAQDRSNATIYAGAAHVDNGFEDRLFAGAFVNVYSDSLGLHGDFAAVDREEEAAFGAVGFSYALTDAIRPKLMVGTSTENGNILPKLYISASVETKPAAGWILTPRLSYREFDSGDEVAPAVDVARYFNVPGDTSGYYVVQAGGAVSFNSSDENGYTGYIGIQTVRSNGLSFGISVEAGKITYDSVIGTGVRTDLLAVRPSVGYRFSRDFEIFLRGEYADTDFYQVTGAMVGLKHSFGQP